MNLTQFFLVVICLMISVCAWAAEPNSGALSDSQAIRLWQGRAPKAKGDADTDIPTLTVALPQHPNGAALVVCPGGGYMHLSDREGMPIARWLNKLGITGFVLKYRLGPTYHHPAEMDDVQRAIRYVRAHAKEWNLDPHRIGVLGFSAGGHLASTAATHFDAGNANAEDMIDRVSCRPDLSILIYPVITMQGPYVHEGSRENLLGKTPDPKLEQLMSNDLQVTHQTPPCFIITTADDRTVPMENSLLFAMACRKNHVPVELHVFEHGRHGFAMAEDDPILNKWMEIAGWWLGRHGFAEKIER